MPDCPLMEPLVEPVVEPVDPDPLVDPVEPDPVDPLVDPVDPLMVDPLPVVELELDELPSPYVRHTSSNTRLACWRW